MNATYYLSYRRKRRTELPQILPDDRLRRLTVEQLRRSWMHETDTANIRAQAPAS